METCTIEIPSEMLVEYYYKVGNQIFKLLPLREEGGAWMKLLDTVILELTGMQKLFPDKTELVSLLIKLKGLKELSPGMDFMDYRRFIFECCTLVTKIRGEYNVDGDHEAEALV